MKVKAIIEIRILEGVLDTQGQAICKALHYKELNQVESVSQGKLIDLVLNVKDLEEAERIVQRACLSMLVNRHVEGFTFHMEEVD